MALASGDLVGSIPAALISSIVLDNGSIVLAFQYSTSDAIGLIKSPYLAINSFWSLRPLSYSFYTAFAYICIIPLSYKSIVGNNIA
jgi:hypothetical protein